ncbi:MAG: cytochrome b/b6 domain-containing protein [Synechococcaceae cyanobacterium RL_1_2]|nr:cytochrome b/b6 domain-containing protein [Synechococcaceae cyanobacterium RL_1_2]
MAKTSPYQSILLRLSHGLAALFTITAWGSGLWIYDNYDGRWGAIGLPKISDIQNIHESIAGGFVILFSVLALYSLRLGYRRLLQPNPWPNLKKVNQPIWWFTLHRGVNTLLLLAGVGAMITGQMMKGRWLPSGELNHGWYLAHLLSWLGLFVALALHLLMAVKVGGVPLLLSMVRWQVRSGDNPRGWWQELRKKDQV